MKLVIGRWDGKPESNIGQVAIFDFLVGVSLMLISPIF